jgi:hypothetical protein
MFDLFEEVKTMCTPRPYYTLVVRRLDAWFEWWTPEFGDYDKSVVEDEREALMDNPFVKTRIVRTTDDQASIDAAIAALNDKSGAL